MLLGENTVKRARGAKVKIFFQGLHMTCHFFGRFITLNFLFWIPILTFHGRYKYKLTTS
jgi:hypothetical protein